MEAMQLSDWAQLKVLKREGNWFHWGEPEKIARDLVFGLDRFCDDLKLEPLVNFGTQGVHCKDSQHYATELAPGRACDVLFPRFSLSQLSDIYLAALKYPFNGLGIYSLWKLSPDGKPIGGMHFDVREITTHRATWVWTEAGELPLTLVNLKDNFR